MPSKPPKRAKPLDWARVRAKTEFEQLWKAKLDPLLWHMIRQAIPPRELAKCMAWEVFNMMRKKGNR